MYQKEKNPVEKYTAKEPQNMVVSYRDEAGKINIIDKHAIIKLWELGKPIRQMSVELEIHRKTVTTIAKKGSGVYEVKLPSSIKGQAFLPDGTEILTDMAVVVVRPNGGVSTAYPYNSVYPRTKSIK